MSNDLNSISKSIKKAMAVFHERNAAKDDAPYALLKNKNVLSSFLNDFVNNYNQEHILKMAVSNDIGNILHEGNGKSAVEQLDIYKRAVKSLTDMGINAEKAEETVRYFTDALEWKLPITTTSESQSFHSGGNAVLGSSGKQAAQEANHTAFGGNAVIGSSDKQAAQEANHTAFGGNAVIGSSGKQAAQEANHTAFSGNVTVGENNPVKISKQNTQLAAQNAELQGRYTGTNVAMQNPPKKKKHGCLIFLLVLLLLIIAGLILCFIYLINKEDNKSDNDVSEITTTTAAIAEEPTTDVVIEATTTESEIDVNTTEDTHDTTSQSTESSVPVKTLARVNSDTGQWQNLGSNRMQYDSVNQILYYIDGGSTVKAYDLRTDETETLPDGQSTARELIFNPFSNKIYADFDDDIYLLSNGSWQKTSLTNHGNNGAFTDNDIFVYLDNGDAVLSSVSSEKPLQKGEPFEDSVTYYGSYYCRSRVVLHNGDYYYFTKSEDPSFENIYYYLFKTVQIIPSTPSTSYSEIKNSNSIVSAGTTSTDVYYFTKNKSFYHLNIDEPGSDELLIQGSDIENSGTNYISDEATQIQYVSDNCFIVFDPLDSCIKLVGELPEAEVPEPTESDDEKSEDSGNYSKSVWIDENGLLQIDMSLIGKNPKDIGEAIGKEITPTEWTYWGSDLTFWEDTNGIGYMFQNNELVIVTYDNGYEFNENVLNAAKQAFSGSVSEKTQNDNPYITIDVNNKCTLELFVEYYTDTQDYHFRQRYISKSMY